LEAAGELIAKYGVNDAINHLSEVSESQRSKVQELIESEKELAAKLAENTTAM
jgi:hypothetical protein